MFLQIQCIYENKTLSNVFKKCITEKFYACVNLDDITTCDTFL